MGLSSVSRPVLGPSTYHPHRPDLLGLWLNSPEINKTAYLSTVSHNGPYPTSAGRATSIRESQMSTSPALGCQKQAAATSKEQSKAGVLNYRQNTLTLPAAPGAFTPHLQDLQHLNSPFLPKGFQSQLLDGGEELNDLAEEGLGWYSSP